jgi:arylsulfatase A-like enzyme
MGEHGFSGGKGLPYIEDVNVPFFIMGPGIESGTTVTQLTANIDLAPTIAEIAGAKTADFVDGRSMMPLLKSPNTPVPDWRNALLIEAGYTNRDNSHALIFRSVRTQEFLYVEYVDGTVEFYDQVADPYEMKNLAPSLDAASLSALNGWLDGLKTCKADDCRDFETSVPELKY